jgi:hypothetical protein
MLNPLLLALATLGAAQNQDVDAQVLERINFHRKAAGLEPVTFDPALSKGCLAHAQYLVKNSDNPSTQGVGMHKEDPKLPGYTEEGAKAGPASVIYPTDKPLAAVDGWIGSIFHRIPLIDPELTKVGFGFAKGGKWGGYLVIDSVTGRGGKTSEKPIVYPGDQQKDVPLKFVSEVPNPVPDGMQTKAGYPITIGFADGVAVKEATASLQEGKQEVAVWLFTPEDPVPKAAVYQRNTICLIPKAPLKPGATYTVIVKATVDKKEWMQTWSFTAAKK